MLYLSTGLVAFLITLAITPMIIRIATACRCMDAPGKRHLHKKTTPRWGGIAFFAGVLPVLFITDAGSSMMSYVIAASLLVAIGVIDDRYKLGWIAKFAANVAAATIVIFWGDAVVHNAGTYGLLGSLDLGRFGIPFTYLGIIGVTNAINLIDGLNGLAGGVSLLGFFFIGVTAAAAGNLPVALVCFAFVGALGAFLLFNFPNARIFMGDSGSLFLGFSLSVMAVYATQHTTAPVEPMFPVLVLLLPIFDTLRVMSIRLLNGRHPFRADKSHLHHLLVRKGLSPVVAVLLLWSMTAIFGVLGFSLPPKTSEAYLIIALYGSLLLSLFAVSLAWRHRVSRDGRFTMRETAGRRAKTPIVDLGTQ